jgi:hypothetical protein
VYSKGFGAASACALHTVGYSGADAMHEPDDIPLQTPAEAAVPVAMPAPVEPEEPPAEKPPRFADSYGLVLVLLIVSYFVAAVAGDFSYGRAILLVVLAATTWLALRASQVERRLLRYAMALIPVVTLGAIVLGAFGSEALSQAVAGMLTALLVVVAPLAIVKRLATHPVINLNTFYGAICVYLLIAMFFASAFALVGVLSGDPFFAQSQPPQKPGTIDFLYFSLTTITTVGYGDLTAAGSVGRMLAVLEAVLGQLYLITVVSLVVQNLGQARRKRQPID